MDWYGVDPEKIVFCTNNMNVSSLKVAVQAEQLVGLRGSSKSKKISSFEAWFMPILAAMESKPWVLNNHMSQQFKFVDGSTKVSKFEDRIIENVKQVQQDMGVEFDFSKNIHRQSSPNEIAIDLSDEMILTIADLYAVDFEKFGYKMEDAGFLTAQGDDQWL